MIAYINKNNKANMHLVMSTPGRYVDALKKANVPYPVYYNDMFPYSDEKDDFWSGFYSSRPSSKIAIKHGSAHLHASNLMFSQRVLN